MAEGKNIRLLAGIAASAAAFLYLVTSVPTLLSAAWPTAATSGGRDQDRGAGDPG
jgi:hypothetical protein